VNGRELRTPELLTGAEAENTRAFRERDRAENAQALDRNKTREHPSLQYSKIKKPRTPVLFTDSEMEIFSG